MKTNTVFIIQGYKKEIDGGRLEDVILFEIFAKTPEEAIKKAKKYLKKPFYRIKTIVEKEA